MSAASRGAAGTASSTEVSVRFALGGPADIITADHTLTLVEHAVHRCGERPCSQEKGHMLLALRRTPGALVKKRRVQAAIQGCGGGGE